MESKRLGIGIWWFGRPALSAHLMGFLMSFGRKKVTISLSVAALGLCAALVLPEAVSFAQQGPAEKLAAVIAPAKPVGSGTLAPTLIPTLTSETLPVGDGDDIVTASAAVEPAKVDTSDPELICMAKVVRHEAANQSRVGQLAVAQLIMNRLRTPGFPKTICGVVHQPGQFFNTNTYHPSKADRLWQTAWDVSVEARHTLSESVIGKALFYNTARARSAFHAGRKHIATIGDHAFFR